MSEREPTFNLGVNRNGETTNFEANRDNATLYRHIGALAIYNHAYISIGDELCTRIWKHDASYAQVEAYMIAKQFPLHDNLRSVNQHDIDAYDTMIAKNTQMDTVPEGWE